MLARQTVMPVKHKRAVRAKRWGVYKQKRENRLAVEAKRLFGPMREATDDESGSVKRYVESISKDTGFKFFDLC